MNKLPQADNIPQELKTLNQWVIWRNELRPGNNKPTKIPYQPRNPSYKAQTDNFRTWSTFNEAMLAARLNDMDGIGFVFTKEDPYVGIDLDSAEKVMEIRNLFNSYAEESWSGRGVHIICTGDLKKAFNNSGEKVECYDSGRYFVFTGVHLASSPTTIETCQEALDNLVEKYGPSHDYEAKLAGLPGGTYDDSQPTRNKYLSWLTHRPAAIQGIGGDEHTFVTVCKGKDFGLSPTAIMECINAEGGWNDLCSPSWSEAELAEKVRSAFDNGKNAPGCDHPTVLGVNFGAVEGGSAAPEIQSILLPDEADTSNIEPLRKPNDGSVEVATLEARLAACAPGDLGEVEAVLRECVYLPTAIHRDRIINMLAAAPFGMTKASVRDNLKHYSREAERLMPNRGVPWISTNEDGGVVGTYENLEQLAAREGISMRFNDMCHTIEYDLGGKEAQFDLPKGGLVDENLGYAFLKNVAIRAGFPVQSLTENVIVVAKRDSYHPFLEYLDETTWDGRPRIQYLLNTLKVAPEHELIRDKLVKTWLLSVIAAVRGYRERAPKGVLVLAGPQNCGKTSWLRYLIPKGMFGEGLHLDPNNKDSKMQSTRYLVVELGELDATFRKSDIASLKAHIGAEEDTFRAPYDRGFSTHKRKTIYAGTVNDMEFLQDDTGNVRFWPITVESINLDEIQMMQRGGDIAQIWSELNTLYSRGEKWFLEQKELDGLLGYIDSYRERSAVEEMMHDLYNWEAPEEDWRERTITAIKDDLGLDRSRQAESKQIKHALQLYGKQYRTSAGNGRVKKIGGKAARVYWIPPKRSDTGPRAAFTPFVDFSESQN